MHEKALSLDDVGTRREHLSELYEQWSLGLDFLNRPYTNQDNEDSLERRRAIDRLSAAVYRMPTSNSEESETRTRAQRSLSFVEKLILPDVPEQRRQSLENAVELLYHALAADYDGSSYAKEINCKFKPEEIKDGRGTPLKEIDDTQST